MDSASRGDSREVRLRAGAGGGLCDARVALEALEALEALGMPYWEAVGTVASSFGPPLARRAWRGYLTQGPAGAEPVLALLDIAIAAPAKLVNTFLQDWLRHRHLDVSLDLTGLEWVLTLPKGLVLEGDLVLSLCGALAGLPTGLNVGGDLEVSRCPALTRLPSGLRVGGDVWASGCRRLRHLPSGLVVGGDLLLRGCPAWDGVIPKDAEIGGRILR